MKFYFVTLLSFFVSGVASLWADVALGNKCEVFLPAVFYEHDVIEKVDAEAIAQSKDYGQKRQPADKRYWEVFGDRNNNITYNGPSLSSGEYSQLAFNERVRIAKIENGFALVYQEPVVQSAYPSISRNAQTYGWIPMDHLLLWKTAPVDEKGIYNKALIVIDADNKSKDRGKVYLNPQQKSDTREFKTDMQIYFVMKQENGLYLLANQYTLDDQSAELYGWVGVGSYIPWNQRSCIEPTWNRNDVDFFRGSAVSIYGDAALTEQASFWKFGAVENVDVRRAVKERKKGQAQYLYRLQKEALRYPILENDSKDSSLYKCTTFAHFSGSLTKAVEIKVYVDSILHLKMDELRHMNLIFVIDGTQSMEKFYRPVINAIKESAKLVAEDITFRVGVVIYRDYDDGEYVTECLPLVKQDDHRLEEFLSKGGEYGIKSSPKDKTKEEALYKGMEVALDNKKMGYNKSQSNLMVIIGDCGNDENDHKVDPATLAKKLIDCNMNMITFQVHNDNATPYLLFNDQTTDLLMETVEAQFARLGLETKMMDADYGYDQRSEVNADDASKADYYVYSIRHAEEGEDMDLRALSRLIYNSLGQFVNTIEKQKKVIINPYSIMADRDTTETIANQKFFAHKFDDDPKQLKQIEEANAMISYAGYTPKRDKTGREYWKPIIYISSDEFANLIKRLQPVFLAANEQSNNRKPYITAMKSLLQSLIPDITDEEMDRKGNAEIMSLIVGLNESSRALKGPTLADIGDETVVSDTEYLDLTQQFAEKYKYLQEISEGDYLFEQDNFGAKYYWIPLEEMP